MDCSFPRTAPVGVPSTGGLSTGAVLQEPCGSPMEVSKSATKPAPEWVSLSTESQVLPGACCSTGFSQNTEGLGPGQGQVHLGQFGTGSTIHGRSFWQLAAEATPAALLSPSLPKPGHTNPIQTKLRSNNSKLYLSMTIIRNYF